MRETQDISAELIKQFEATYQMNYLGVRLSTSEYRVEELNILSDRVVLRARIARERSYHKS